MERLHTLVYLAFLAFVLFVVAQAADATGIASKGLPPEPASTPEPESKGLPPKPAVRRRGTCKAIPKLSRGNCGSGRFAKADGKQHPDIPTCSKTQMGQIPDAQHMPTTVILKPQDQSTVTAKQDFEISVAVHNLATGFFSDPEIQYYVGAQQLNAEGVIMGHCHVTVQAVPKNPKSPPDPTKFAFFKGLNDVAKNGILTVDVTGGLDTGFYRLCTLCSSFTHQPTLMPVAKRGAQDDCIRFNVS